MTVAVGWFSPLSWAQNYKFSQLLSAGQSIKNSQESSWIQISIFKEIIYVLIILIFIQIAKFYSFLFSISERQNKQKTNLKHLSDTQE